VGGRANQGSRRILLDEKALWRDDWPADHSGLVTADEAEDVTPPTTHRELRKMVDRAASARRERAYLAAGGVGIVAAILLDVLVGWSWIVALLMGLGLVSVLFAAVHFLRTAFS
jgi:hypothetical protein